MASNARSGLRSGESSGSNPENDGNIDSQGATRKGGRQLWQRNCVAHHIQRLSIESLMTA